MAVPSPVINWPLVREDFVATCRSRNVTQKLAADEMAIPESTLTRFKQGKTVSADYFMLLCWWMSVEPTDYRII